MYADESPPSTWIVSPPPRHPPCQAIPLVDCMAAMLDMRNVGDLTRGPLRPDSIRRLAKGLYNVRVSGGHGGSSVGIIPLGKGNEREVLAQGDKVEGHTFGRWFTQLH